MKYRLIAACCVIALCGCVNDPLRASGSLADGTVYQEIGKTSANVGIARLPAALDAEARGWWGAIIFRSSGGAADPGVLPAR